MTDGAIGLLKTSPTDCDERCVRNVVEPGSSDVTYGSIGHVLSCYVDIQYATPLQLVASLLAYSHLLYPPPRVALQARDGRSRCDAFRGFDSYPVVVYDLAVVLDYAFDGVFGVDAVVDVEFYVVGEDVGLGSTFDYRDGGGGSEHRCCGGGS